MNIWLNNHKVSTVPIQPTTTIGQVKIMLDNWLRPQGYTNYQVRLVFNNGTELPPNIFETNTYDQTTFRAQANILNGGNIHITGIKQKPQPPNPCVGEEVNILIDMRQGIVIYVTTDIEDAYRYYLDHHIHEDHREDIYNNVFNVREGEINYGDPDVRDFLFEDIRDHHMYLFTEEIRS